MFDDVNMVRWMLGVLSLILMFGGLILVLKRLQENGQFTGTFKGLRPQGRLSVTETLQVDSRRKLIMVEDGVDEHLILLGTTQEILVSSRPVGKKPKTVSQKPRTKPTTKPKAKKAS